MLRRSLIAFSVSAVLFAAGGASCQRAWLAPFYDPAPVVFNGTPTLEQVLAVVNAQSERVHQLETQGARLALHGGISLRTSIALERPRRFRLRAGTGLTGAELDVGSNDDLFWLWAQRNDPPAVFFCRHEDFRHSAARQVLPIPPDWFIEALGVVYLDPRGRHEGPFPVRANRLEVRSTVPAADGHLVKVTVIDDRRGFVLEQHVYDLQGQRLASAIASDHRFDAASGAALPHHVEIQLPPAQMSFSIDVGQYRVNQLGRDTAALWTVPTIAGTPFVDLGDPRLRGAPAGPPAPGHAAGGGYAPPAALAPYGPASYGGAVGRESLRGTLPPAYPPTEDTPPPTDRNFPAGNFPTGSAPGTAPYRSGGERRLPPAYPPLSPSAESPPQGAAVPSRTEAWHSSEPWRVEPWRDEPWRSDPDWPAATAQRDPYGGHPSAPPGTGAAGGAANAPRDAYGEPPYGETPGHWRR